LVYRELQTEHWYATPEEKLSAPTVQEMIPIPLAVQAKRNENGVHASTRACVVCGTDLPDLSPLGGQKTAVLQQSVQANSQVGSLAYSGQKCDR